MALTITSVAQGDYTLSNKKVKTRDVTFDSSYATGGLSLKPSDVNLRAIVMVSGEVGRAGAAGATGAVVAYDYVNQKLQAYVSNGASPALLNEAPATTNLSTVKVRLQFTGF